MSMSPFFLQLETEKDINYLVIANLWDCKVKIKGNFDKRDVVRGLVLLISNPYTNIV
jgi:hypothetical protein